MLGKRKNRVLFQKALAEAGKVDGMVCGTVQEDGTPTYFVMPKNADDRQVRERAFLLRNGRPMTALEQQMLDIASRRAASD